MKANKHLVADDGDPRKYYAAIPNIIFSLGLNPYELSLYVYLKKVAGESGTCWKSTATIAKELKVGVGTVSRTKALLAEPRDALGGKALITITIEMQNGGNPNHSITITDIWPENMAELTRVREGKATRSSVEGARSTGGQRVPQTNATRSTDGDKEEPLKNNPEEEETRGRPFDHFAVIEYTKTLKPEPPLSIFQAEAIANAVDDSPLSREVWTRVLEVFKGNGYQPRYAGNAVNRYRSEMAKIAEGKRESPLPASAARVETLKEKFERGVLA